MCALYVVLPSFGDRKGEPSVAPDRAAILVSRDTIPLPAGRGG
jgi:hypothetical protein